MALKTQDMQVADHVQFLCLEHPTTNLRKWLEAGEFSPQVKANIRQAQDR